jgi:zinc/manganese transport system ATP-binding protein
VSFLPQQQHLDRQFPISLQELVAAGFWGTRLTPQQRSERLHAVLEDWHLSGLEQRPLMALSGGELQRALLARMSLAEAPVLLLDEPHAALDEDGQACVGNISTPGMTKAAPWSWSVMTWPPCANTPADTADQKHGCVFGPAKN